MSGSPWANVSVHTAVDDPSSQPSSLSIPPLPPSLLISPNPNLTQSSSSLPKYRYTKWLSALVKLAPTTSSGSSFVAPTPSLLRDVAVNERCSPRCVRRSQHVENKLGFILYIWRAVSLVLLDFAFLRMSFTVVMPEIHAEVLLVRVTRLLLWTNRRHRQNISFSHSIFYLITFRYKMLPFVVYTA